MKLEIIRLRLPPNAHGYPNKWDKRGERVPSNSSNFIVVYISFRNLKLFTMLAYLRELAEYNAVFIPDTILPFFMDLSEWRKLGTMVSWTPV